MKDYRKLYEQYYGPIPRDTNGRTYEIHHIDGNHKNNEPKNLIAVSIQEHYNIHYSQGDWGACQAMTVRMNQTPEEISKICSELAKKNTQKRIEERTHNFQTRLDGTNLQTDRVAAGIHPWLGPELNNKRIENGTHNLLGKNLTKVTCPHCGLVGKGSNMKRYHFDNCKWK